MTKFREPGLRAAVMAVCLLAGSASAGVPDIAAGRVAQAPAEAWQAFLETAESLPVYGAYQALGAVEYTATGVGEDACRSHREQIAEAVQTVPVSLAIRRAAMMCAEALGDEETAEREMAAVAALSKLAWSQASEVAWAAPIRVVHPIDAYALLLVSGLEFRYDYYLQVLPDTYMPMGVAAWDPEIEKERLLRFDAVDTAFRIEHESPFSGFPYQRRAFADAFLQGQSDGGEYLAADLQAVREATQVVPAERLALLRPAARRGGILSGAAWLTVCARNPLPGCGDGFVATWLPAAEQHQVIPMVLLAYAYAHGIGVEADRDTAVDLLDAADRLSLHDAASVSFADLSLSIAEGPLPEAVVQRLQAAIDHGNPNAPLMLARNAVRSGPLDASTIAYLRSSQANTDGAGYWALVTYHKAHDAAAEYASLRDLAAQAGNPEAQAALAFALLEHDPQARKRDEAMRWMQSAANAGNVSAQRYMAYRAIRERDWAEAEAWLMDPVIRGDFASILLVASLYEAEVSGVHGTLERAITVYRMMAETMNSAEARRRLARLALAGKGMERDAEQARQWLVVDAEAGDHLSQGALGMAYLNGDFGAPDEQAAMRWLQPALDAGATQVQVNYAGWLYFTKATTDARKHAMTLWRKAHEQGEALASNNLAWAYCTSPDPAIHDAPKGLRIADGMGPAVDMTAASLDTRAACHAANGDFDGARRYQTKAIELVAELEPADGEEDNTASDGSLAGFQSRLALYVAGKRYIETVRD